MNKKEKRTVIKILSVLQLTGVTAAMITVDQIQ